ncbi:CHASE3 domain-containing protein [Methylobacillus gramineus]|uniref:sensor histidine kinase n=1 Tax=Methylobacillus gramineus TaxID=755169 RepID=UPI001CFF5D46|nr:sensor histidine kinase [Methylobacillus gramineus]MCB5184199.1 CHASE3 domain-containing protein [Methylobacillus gramineus]
MNPNKSWLTLAGLLLALTLLLSLSYITYNRTNQFLASSRWVDHTYQVILQLNTVLSELKDAETGQRGYLLSNNDLFLAPYNKAVINLPRQIKQLQDLSAQDQADVEAINTISDLILQRLDHLKVNIDRQRQEGQLFNHPGFTESLESGKAIMDNIRNLVGDISFRQQRLLADRAKVAEREASSTLSWIVFGNLTVVILLMSSFIVIIKEVKKRMLAQREAEQVAAQLQVTNKELESFSYSVSHDLRSPLRAIDGYSRMLEEDYSDILDQEGLRLLEVVRVNSKKMGQLIDDLLNFARSGRKELVLEEIDIRALANEAWKEVNAENKHPDVQFNNQVSLPSQGDKALIKQVLLNLLSNALKYSSPKAMPIISVTSEHANNQVLYTITDNGVGFDMTYAHKLFGVFQRLHTSEEFPGTGVGLAIVQRIIVRHGGSVTATSILEQGSAFSFSLPGRM